MNLTRFRKAFRPESLSFFVLLIGLVVTLILYAFSVHYEQDIVEKEFIQDSVNQAKKIEQEIYRGMDILTYMESFYTTTSPVNYEKFQLFTSHILSTHPEVKALEWSPLVKDQQRLDFEHAMQKYFPGFSFTEKENSAMVKAKQRDIYYPVYYLAPYAGNENALGYDLASNTERLSALHRARDSGRIQMTSRIVLVQEKQMDSYGIIAFQPMYKNNASNITLEQRRNHLIGFLLAVYRINDIVEAAIQFQQMPELTFRLVDKSAALSDSLLFESPGYGDKANTDFRLPFVESDALNYNYSFKVGEREWELQFMPIDGFYAAHFGWRSIAVLIIGSLFTLMVYVFMRSMHKNVQNLHKAERQLKRANQELTLLSKLDPTLKVANRRHFDYYLYSEWKRAIRTGHSLCLIMADVDYFKGYNDAYGHVVGDHCLRQIAEAFTATANRPADLVARYGGEEIAVILPETSLQGAYHIAESIRTAIEELAMPHRVSEVSAVVTVSFGLGAIVPSEADSVTDFIHQVDKQLYLAKKTGKNRVCSIDIKDRPDEVRCFQTRQVS